MSTPLILFTSVAGLILGVIALLMVLSVSRGVRSASSWARTTARIRTFSFSYGVPGVTYDYEVEGAMLPGQNILPGPLRSPSRSGGMTLPRRTYVHPDGTLRFRPDSEVEAYYDPRNPTDAALVVGIPPGIWQGFVFLLFFAGILGAFVWTPAWLSQHKVPLVAAFFSGAGFIAFAFGIKNLKRHLDSRAFPSTAGRVLKAEIVYRGSGDSSGYVPSVEFAYAVDGVPYQSGQLTALNAQVLKSGAAGVAPFIENLKAEPDVTVYYNPRSPWDGFLQHGPLWGAVMLVLMGALFAGVGLAIYHAAR